MAPLLRTAVFGRDGTTMATGAGETVAAEADAAATAEAAAAASVSGAAGAREAREGTDQP